MSAQKKKISLDFGRMSGEKAREMSSATIGDIGPSKIDELIASINVMDGEEAIQNFGSGAMGPLAKPSLWKRMRNAVGLTA